MSITYTIQAENFNANSLTANFKNVPSELVESCVEILNGGFRSVEVCNDETGEVVYQFYRGEEFFEPETTAGAAFDAVNELLERAEISANLMPTLQEIVQYIRDNNLL